jgi:hypothetical protein
MKYAIKVCLDGKDDWLYVTERTRNCMDLVPVLFDDEESAENYAISWRLEGKADMVKVVNYDEG